MVLLGGSLADTSAQSHARAGVTLGLWPKVAQLAAQAGGFTGNYS